MAGGIELTTHVPREEYLVPIGKAVVKRPGTSVTVVATHISLYRALAAAQELAAEGIECEVIDPLSLVPLDTETLWASVRKTGRLVIVHEDTLTGGWGAEIAARAADECLFSLEAPIKRVAAYDVPLPVAPIMEQTVVPSVARIKATIKGICQ
jgi:pyruvate dehydrogenase E1 component beta subunit